MTLTELEQVLESLFELSVDVEEFNWGPTYAFAKDRKSRAIEIIKKEISKHKVNANGNVIGKQANKEKPKEPSCCVCGTTKNLHKDGWYGYRCSSDDCIVF